ncbi:hypothetical protein B0H14DRAFT_3135315, partial [Mycena olivaceomarginata]
MSICSPKKGQSLSHQNLLRNLKVFAKPQSRLLLHLVRGPVARPMSICSPKKSQSLSHQNLLRNPGSRLVVRPMWIWSRKEGQSLSPQHLLRKPSLRVVAKPRRSLVPFQILAPYSLLISSGRRSRPLQQFSQHNLLGDPPGFYLSNE